MAKKRDFYSRPAHERISIKVFEGLISAGAVYLLSPYLLQILAPVQAQINANALNNGQTPPTQGANAVANTLIVPPGASPQGTS